MNLPILDKKIIDNFLSKSSFAGLLTLYFIKLKFDKKQAFDKSDFEPINEGGYSYGYFVATSAFGILSYTKNKEIINIIELDSYFSEQIKNVIISKAEYHDKEVTDLLWKDDITRIENL